MRAQNRKPVSGTLLRMLADRAAAAGQKQLCIELHELAREQETQERKEPTACSAR